MNNPNELYYLSLEFEFLRDRLKQISILLMRDEKCYKKEASIMIDCLRSICNEIYEQLTEKSLNQKKIKNGTYT
jgi:hypothetical protein